MSQQGEVTQEGRRLSGGAIASLFGLAVLLIFIIQNKQDVRFHFLWFNFTWPLWLYTIVIALFGALAWFGLGVIRRHRRRKERREYRRGRLWRWRFQLTTEGSPDPQAASERNAHGSVIFPAAAPPRSATSILPGCTAEDVRQADYALVVYGVLPGHVG